MTAAGGVGFLIAHGANTVTSAIRALDDGTATKKQQQLMAEFIRELVKA